MSTDRDEIFGGLSKGTIMYCLNCERTYAHGVYRILSEEKGERLFQMCPYEDCDADAVLNAREWEWVLTLHPEYPKTPVSSVVYPLHS